MIDFLQGELVSKTPAEAIIRVAGVGFCVRIPLSTYDVLPKQGHQVTLLTHLHVREEDLSLFGFGTRLERDLFRMLLGVSHVGPVVAIRILSSCSPAQFKRYILDEDFDALKTMVKGIGPKTAKRLILELQGPVQDLAVAPTEALADRVARDAILALVALGEPREAAEKAVRAAIEKLGPDADGQTVVQKALGR